eukprot:GHUV01000883.1.p1 GENE.GHUV01000883.1~~GHUV01000883.1.p1  ORF type:complete len:637 (+),score=229.81 GHUV01000883.1:67-1911(+)
MADDIDMAGPAPSEVDDFDYETDEKLVNVEKDISGDGGLKKTILRLGQGWESPEKGDECTVHYVGTLLDGTKFDSSRDRGDPFTFPLGQGRVIKGWDQGVATMKKGELAKLVCRADYAYGAAGSPPTIPPDATLQFEVELIDWKSVKDITGDGGVIKSIQTEGQGWQNPKDEDEVVITYTARVHPVPEDGTKPQSAEAAGLPVVASSPEGGSVFYIKDSPCKGFTAALKSMKLKESVVLLLSPEYAAGIAEVPDGHQLKVQLELTELHQVSQPAPGVTKKTLADPEGSYQKPSDGTTVTIVVTTKSGDGQTVYEAEREVEYTTDEELVPEGLELAVGSMKAGEHAIVTVTDPALTSVPEGAVAGTGVPAGTAPVVYDVTLKTFTKVKERWEMNNQEKIESALARKEKGNAAYKAGKLVRAARQYHQAVETANSVQEKDMAPNPVDASTGPSVGSLLSQAKDIKKACMNNWAAVELKRKNWAEAAKQASKVLDVDPSNVKALYRRAQARMGLAEFVEAEVDIKSGLLTEPENADLQSLYKRLKVQMREVNKKEAKLYGKMFAALGKGSSTEPAAAAANGHADAAAAPMDEDQPGEPSAAGNGTADAAAPVVEATA